MNACAAGKEVALGISHKVGWFDIGNAAFIHVPRRDGAISDGLAHDLRFEWIDFVVIGWQAHSVRGQQRTANSQQQTVMMPSNCKLSAVCCTLRLRRSCGGLVGEPAFNVTRQPSHGAQAQTQWLGKSARLLQRIDGAGA